MFVVLQLKMPSDAQSTQHVSHMVTSLPQYCNTTLMWYVEQRHDHVAQKSVQVTYTLVCILYKLSGPTNPDVLLQKIISTLNSFA